MVFCSTPWLPQPSLCQGYSTGPLQARARDKAQPMACVRVGVRLDHQCGCAKHMSESCVCARACAQSETAQHTLVCRVRTQTCTCTHSHRHTRVRRVRAHNPMYASASRLCVNSDRTSICACSRARSLRPLLLARCRWLARFPCCLSSLLLSGGMIWSGSMPFLD